MSDDEQEPRLELIRSDEAQETEDHGEEAFHTDQILLDFQLRAQRLNEFHPTGNQQQDFEDYCKLSGKDNYMSQMSQLTDQRDFLLAMMTIREGLDKIDLEQASPYTKEVVTAEIGAIDRMVSGQLGNIRMLYASRNSAQGISGELALGKLDVMISPEFNKAAYTLSSALGVLQQYCQNLVAVEARIDAAYFDIRSIESEMEQAGATLQIAEYQEIKSSWTSIYHNLKAQLAAQIAKAEVQRANLLSNLSRESDAILESPKLNPMMQEFLKTTINGTSVTLEKFEQDAQTFEARRERIQPQG